jgi:predicted MFS family arabinose efflux permease
LAGVLADRWPSKKLMFSSQAVTTFALLAVPLAHWLGWLTIEGMYVLELVLGGAYAVLIAASQVYAMRLVGIERMVEANSLVFGCESVASLLGPGIAGWLVSVVAPSWAISINGLCVAAAILLLWPNAEVASVRDAHEKTTSIVDDFILGWRALWQGRLLRLLTVAGAIQQILFQGHVALQILLATTVLGLSPSSFGMVLMAGGVGAFLASLVVAGGARRFGQAQLLIAALMALGVVWLALGVLPRNAYTVWLMAPVIFALDVAMTGFGIVFVSMRQAASPAGMMGRVTATSRFVSFAAAPLGGVAFGWMGEQAGLRFTYLTMGAVGIVLTLMLAWMWRSTAINIRLAPA